MPEIIFSGFVSKVINDIVDVSKNKIKKAVKDKATKYQNLESQIYNITVDVLNKKTDNQYENNQDNIYNAAEILLRSFKGHDEDGCIKSCLRALNLMVDENGCMEFRKTLYEELGKNEYSELFRAILLLLLEQKNRYDNAAYEQLYQKLDEIEGKVDKLNQKSDDIPNENEGTINKDKVVKFQNDKKQNYIEIWNSRMFLHLDNDEHPITLENAFIMPDFIWIKSVKSIGFCTGDTFDKVIEKFVKYNRTSTMLITGVPGIGKSTIASWIANEYKEDDSVIVLRFRDWSYEELANGLLKSIYNTLQCKKSSLENKVLVLDGFDEMKALNIRDNILSDFFSDIKDFYNFKCIVTSRPAYIDSYYFQNVLVLEVFDIGKIDDFCEKITGKKLENMKNIETNLEVLGIPVILYMAIMSGVDISENPTKPELYNRIFAENGGIFDRFFDGETEYGSGAQILRKPENIKKYLKFLANIAFKMFEKNDPKIGKNECEIPELEFEKKKISVLEFPIKHLFESTETNIEFIHRSIYEYFVSEYIYNIFLGIMKKTKEEMAGEFARILKSNRLLNVQTNDGSVIIPQGMEILEFLKYRFESGKLKNEFNTLHMVFELMIHDGMTFYSTQPCKNVIKCEMTIFSNMLDILHLWDNYIIKLDDQARKYLLYSAEYGFDLSKVDLTNVILERIDIGVRIENALFDIKQIKNLENMTGIKNLIIHNVAIKNGDQILSYMEYCHIQPYDYI